ncbi:MAG: SRPBCC family protein [Chloroflexota bacterium]
MIITRVTVKINRPVAEVFAYVTDPASFPRWAGSLVKESRKISAGPVGVGTTFTQMDMLMGRRFTSKMRVVTYEPQ